MSRLTEAVSSDSEKYRETKVWKAREAYGGGAFFRDGLAWPEEQWPLEAGRYSLIWLPACPRAQRTALSLRLLGLERVIPMVELVAHRTKDGWELPEGENVPPGIRFVKDLYDEDVPASQPLLFDTRSGKVVTDDQYNMSLYFAKDWRAFHGDGALPFYPEGKRDAIDAMNGFIYWHVNVQIYKAAYAATPAKHEAGIKELAVMWELLDDHLSASRFLLGEQVTDADLRLFPNLLRFEIYYSQFGLHTRHLVEYPHLWRYAQELYRIPAFQETSKLELITETHFRSPHNLKRFGDKFAGVSTEEVFADWL